MSGNHNNTRNHNMDFLINSLNFTKIGNSSLFLGNNILLFSPSVAKNSQGYYWFDIREVNTIKKDKLNLQKCYVLIRIVPDMFILVNWDNFEPLLKAPRMKKDGQTWEFLIEDNFSILRNRNAKDIFIPVQCVDKQELVNQFVNSIKE